jgi:regulator of sigma E protease
MLKWYVVGVAGLVGLVVLNVAAMAGARYFAARAAGVPGVRFPFHDGAPASWTDAPRWARPLVVASGPAANYLCAALLFSMSLLIGGEAYRDTTVDVIEGRPAAEAGVKTGDRVRSVGGAPTERWDDLVRTLRQHAGASVEIMVERGDQVVPIQVVPNEQGKIGVSAGAGVRTREVGGIEALATGLATPLKIMGAAASGFLKFFSDSTERELAGPARIVEETATTAESRGLADTMYFLAALNAYFWPGFVIAAIATMPGRKKRR